MGTRSITVFVEATGAECCTVYKQFDGYPSGLGAALRAFLITRRLVNGLTGDQTREPVRSTVANGMGDLARQWLVHYGAEHTDMHLLPSGERDRGEEYIYTVYESPRPDTPAGAIYQPGEIRLKVTEGDMTAFGLPGTPAENMATLFDGDPEDFSPDNPDE